jgi:hypothetical protein
MRKNILVTLLFVFASDVAGTTQPTDREMLTSLEIL